MFVDKCHHSKEENLLFPAMEAVGIPRQSGPISAMLSEHQTGRKYIQCMQESFDTYMTGEKTEFGRFVQNAINYVDLLRLHIEKENQILFPMVDEWILENKWGELIKGFQKIEEDRIGPGKHEEFHKMLEELKGIYLTR